MIQPSIHATAIVIDGCGILLRGGPGSGKSSLALRLIDNPGYGADDKLLRAELVADDQVCLTKQENEIFLSPPHSLRGLLEVRGLGIVTMPYCKSAKLCLVVDLCPGGEIPRLPEAQDQEIEIQGLAFRRIAIDPFRVASPAIMRVALNQ